MTNVAALTLKALICLVAAAASGAALAACGDDSSGGDGGGAGGGSALEGATWVLTAYSDGTASLSVPAKLRVDVTFADGKISGQAPVNSYSGTYSTSSDSGIAIGPVASTMMAGPEKAMALETAYFAALEAVTTYAVDGAGLTLSDDQGTALLIFIAEAAPSLSGRTWNVTGYNNGNEAFVSLVTGSSMTAVFGDTGTVSGSSGVNTYSGPYTVDGRSIEVGDLATTKMAGSAELMQQEQQYIAALRSAATWSIRGDTLELRTADDALAATFAAEPLPD